MALLFVQISSSIDGFFADADGGVEWFTEDQAVEVYATETLRTIDLGKVGICARRCISGISTNPDAQAQPSHIVTRS